MNINLQGKTALVTGASGQLGRVMARSFAAAGADVIVHYAKSKAMAESLAAEIVKMGRRVLPIQADITDISSVNNMRDIIARDFRLPDIVVNNAVIQYTWKSILEQDPADFQSQFASCVLQSVLTAKAFIPEMINRGGGRFIGINTETTALCHAGTGAYAAGKCGMDGLYRVLAKEVGESAVTVNQVAPGWTISDRDREQGTTEAPEYTGSVPLARRGTDVEVAQMVLFIASDLASYITGAHIPVSGGRVC